MEAFEYDEFEEKVETKDKEQGKTVKEKKVEETTSEVSKTEEDARSEGWVPEEEWKGDPDSWVDAKQFVFRGELMQRIKKQSSLISNQNSEVKELKDALRALGEHNKKIAEAEFKRAINSLKKQKAVALEDEDHDTVVELDDQITDLKEANKEVQNEETTQESEKVEQKVPAEVTKWLQDPKNKWYDDDIILRGAADSVFINYINTNPNDFSGALEQVEKQMRKRFPTDFGVQTNRERGAVTETDGRSSKPKDKGKKGNKFTAKDLNEEQLRVARTYVNQGVFKNTQEYVDQLADLGEIEV